MCPESIIKPGSLFFRIIVHYRKTSDAENFPSLPPDTINLQIMPILSHCPHNILTMMESINTIYIDTSAWG
jgi:hypothetical protein